MLKQFAVKVVDTIVAVDGRTHVQPSEFVKEVITIDGRSFITTSDDRFPKFSNKQDAEQFMATLPICHGRNGYTNHYEYSVEEIEWTHANHCGWSDVHPYEIVRVVSDKTIELRAVDAELHPEWKPKTEVGGFFGHTVNNGSQKWLYQSNESNPVFKARLRKDGYFHSKRGRHVLSKEPYKFYDYNY